MAKEGPRGPHGLGLRPVLGWGRSRWRGPELEPPKASHPTRAIFRNPFPTRIKIVLF